MEEEWIQKTCEQIAAFKPDLVITGKEGPCCCCCWGAVTTQQAAAVLAFAECANLQVPLRCTSTQLPL